jgi:ligand-binding sensor domain-containing protein
MKKTAFFLLAIAVAIAAGAYFLVVQENSTVPDAAESLAGPDPDAHFTHFRVGQRNVKTILADGDVTWVGTSGGVLRYDTKHDSYKLYDNSTGLLANGIFHLSKLNGKLVAGTYGGGLSILNAEDETWKNYNIPDGLGDGFIYDVLELENGDVWIATWSGVNRVRGGDLDDRSKWDLFTVANTNGGLPNDWVYALRPGENGVVWLATEGGLSRFKDDEWHSWGHAEGLGAPYELVRDQIEFLTDPAQYSEHHARQKVEMGLEDVDIAFNPNYIVALEVSRNGNVWAGTWGGGLSRFDGSDWKVYTVADGLPGNHVFMLHEDQDGILWIGTNNGLARMDGDSFKRFTTADGLFSNRVFAMSTAADGTRWIGSFGGVARIAKLR